MSNIVQRIVSNIKNLSPERRIPYINQKTDLLFPAWLNEQVKQILSKNSHKTAILVLWNSIKGIQQTEVFIHKSCQILRKSINNIG